MREWEDGNRNVGKCGPLTLASVSLSHKTVTYITLSAGKKLPPYWPHVNSVLGHVNN